MSNLLKGQGVSSGVAVGRVRLRSEFLPIVPVPVPPERIEEEVERFHAAREAAKLELVALHLRLKKTLGDAYAGIIDVQRLILDDARLVDETVQRITLGRHSAGWSLKEVVSGLQRSFAEVDDPYLRERVVDLEDLHRRLQRHLRGETRNAIGDRGPEILVAPSIGPSDMIALEDAGVLGLATDTGGPTSHTAILAHALSIPAVLGLQDLSHRVRTGDEIILDGDQGLVRLNPSPEELQEALSRVATLADHDRHLREASKLPTITRDGTSISLAANLEFVREAASALDYGADGVGLYRSEFLFLAHSPDLPTEDDHFEAYRELMRTFPDAPVTIRTLDLGGEKYFHAVLDQKESNPVLGLRAIRFCLRRPEILRTQLRGALRAAAYGNLRLMVPLVTHVEELRTVRRMLREEAQSLTDAGVEIDASLPLGTMIEVPAAAIAADILATEAEFFSIGTNDLIQYALAVDRGNPSVADLYQPLHPAILRMLKIVFDSARKADLPVSLCGEMAAEPEFTALLLGLGLREFSVQPRALGPVREAIRRADMAPAGALAEAALRSATAEEVRSLLEVSNQTEGDPVS